MSFRSLALVHERCGWRQYPRRIRADGTYETPAAGTCSVCRRLIPLLAKQPVVICMAADPEPHKTVVRFDRKCPILTANPNRPETTHCLEMQSRMMRIVFQVRVGAIGEPLDLGRQGSVAGPEIE